MSGAAAGCGQIGQKRDILGVGQAGEFLQRPLESPFHHLLLGAQRQLAGLQPGHIPQPFFPLGGGQSAPLQGGLGLGPGPGLIVGQDFRCLGLGLGGQIVDLALDVGLDLTGDFFDTVHRLPPFLPVLSRRTALTERSSAAARRPAETGWRRTPRYRRG